jgi:DNA-binding NarL/FixJ family response regulator
MNPLRAFIVEDSPVIRESLIAMLEEMTPMRVVGTAEDEATAVRSLTDSTKPVDIAIIDVFLRGGSGLGVLKALRDAGTDVERVVLTNYATAEMRRHCLALGAARVFDKSGDIDALVTHCIEKSSTTGPSRLSG